MTTVAHADAAERPPADGGKRPWLDGLSLARRGALLFIIAGLVFTANDSLTKVLVSNVPVADVIWGRHIAYLVAVIIMAGRGHPRRLLATSRKWTQVARGLAMFGALYLFDQINRNRRR